MSRVLPLVSNEVYKIFHQKISYLYVFSIAGSVLLSIFGVSQVTGGTDQEGFLYLTTAMRATFNFIGVIVLLVFSSGLISSEVEKGTVRSILTAQISRLNFFWGKAAAALIFQEILILAAAVTGILVEMIYFGFSNPAENNILIYTKNQMITNFLFACLAVSLPLFAVTSYGLLISSLVRNTARALGLSIASFIIIDIAKEKLEFAPYFFSSYIGTPFAIVDGMIQGFYFNWTPKIYHCIGISLIWITIFLSIGTIKTIRRDFNG